MMITDDALAVVQEVMDSTPQAEWIDEAKKALPAIAEDDIIEMVMFLNVGDVIELGE